MEASQTNNTVVTEVEDTNSPLEEVLNFFFTTIKKLEIDESVPCLKKCASDLIAGAYPIDEVKATFQGKEISRADQSGFFSQIADELIRQLAESIAKKRMASRRNMSSISAMTKKDADKKGGPKRKKIKPGEEDADPTVSKMSIDDIGREIAEQAEEDEKRKVEREEEAKEVAGEQALHAAAYQVAFQLYADAVQYQATAESQCDSLVKNIHKLGDPDLTTRQMAVENILADENIKLAYIAFRSALKDKVISAKVLKGFGHMGHFEVVPELLNIYKESVGTKEATSRGTAAQVIGDIVRGLNGKVKGRGSKKFYALVKADPFEEITLSFNAERKAI